MKAISRKLWGLILAALLAAGPVPACGPQFPNNFLESGETTLFAAPQAEFYAALDRIKLPPPRFHASVPTNGVYGYAAQTTATDLADLRAALRLAKVPTREKDALLKAHAAEREKLDKYSEESTEWHESNQWGWTDGEFKLLRKPTPPKFPAVQVVPGLPPEIGDYFRGSVAWHQEHTNEARAIWSALLARPAAERHFRSTWAAYMLGRSANSNKWDQALQSFQQVRSLATEGFADTLGLAAASLGWEARIHLQRNQFEAAIELYLQQYATRDWTAGESLRVTAAKAFHSDGAPLSELARNPHTRAVLTAYVLTRDDRGMHLAPGPQAPVRAWLAAVEAAGVRDVGSAEQLALAAYQNDDMETAQRWINRAARSPTAQWLEAKLLLREGKVDRAAKLLASVVDAFPIEPATTNARPKTTFADSLEMDFPYNDPAQQTVAIQVRAELGALRLTRREYLESLDALLRTGYWLDAAYVGERVLTIEELQAYVDQQWPAGDAGQSSPATANPSEPPHPETDGVTPPPPGELAPELLRERIRYLLGRRLTRLSRGAEAAPYFPPAYRPRQQALLQALDTGRDPALSADARAASLFAAAQIARHEGMELFGTECAPDWHYTGGNFEFELTPQDRATNTTTRALIPSADELRRYAASGPDPNTRFHYRYQAAFLAYEAAGLMPDNSPATALVLCTAGSWLKARDPQTADIFYKALVRRCRKTALGAEADRKRWFPELDANGEVIKPSAVGIPPDQQ